MAQPGGKKKKSQSSFLITYAKVSSSNQLCADYLRIEIFAFQLILNH